MTALAQSVNGKSMAMAEALRLARLGYSVFPCAAGTKVPATEHGFHDASTDRGQIKRWWRSRPTANVAIATVGLLVIDIDGADNPWPAGRKKDFAGVPKASTPRGGKHYYFRRPPGKRWKCSQGELADHVDVRTEGGYVVVAPSRTQDGEYAWVRELSVGADHIPLPPPWLENLLDDLDRAPPKGDTLAEEGAIAVGRRNATLTSYAGAMRRRGMAQEAIAAALTVENAARCAPPLDDAEVARIAGSVSRYAPAPTTPTGGGYRFTPQTPAQLAATVKPPAWLVERLLVAGQPAIIGGPKKSLKTSLAIDLAVSLESGTPFLGLDQFAVPKSLRVAFLSGESGDWSILETIRRICAARKRKAEKRDGLLIDFRLPQLGRPGDVLALAQGLREHDVDVVMIDPLYLALLVGTDAQASNLYDVGPLLSAITRRCLDAGATPVYLHHTRKGLPAGEPAELEDLAFAGVAEFARQWLLLNRREKYDPETGTHRLWLGAGGSCGQAGLWAVDVCEGRLSDDFGGRTWPVKVTSAGEHHGAEREEREAARRDKSDAQTRIDADAVLAALDRLDSSGAGAGWNRVQDAAGLSDRRMLRAVLCLQDRGDAKEKLVMVTIGSGAARQVRGIGRIR